MTVDLSTNYGYRYRILPSLTDNESIKMKKDNIDIINKVVDTYKTTHLNHAAISTNEIMIKCDTYYYIQYTTNIYFQTFSDIFEANI